MFSVQASASPTCPFSRLFIGHFLGIASSAFHNSAFSLSAKSNEPLTPLFTCLGLCSYDTSHHIYLATIFTESRVITDDYRNCDNSSYTFSTGLSQNCSSTRNTTPFGIKTTELYIRKVPFRNTCIGVTGDLMFT